jgi:methylmalonyl-CoA mutase N-terminal domain/subunit
VHLLFYRSGGEPDFDKFQIQARNEMSTKNPPGGESDAIDVQAHIGNSEVKLSRTRTWSGIETKDSYTPDDVPEMEYRRDLGDPGQYPYTRGAFPQMYRSRMWTLRNIVGYGAPEDTRAGIELALKQGTAGINVVVDTLTQQAIDPDHPAFGFEVGCEGCSLPTVRDVERLLANIDITQTDVAWHWTMMAYPMVAAVAVKEGRDLSRMIGSHMPDHLQLTLSGWGTDVVPADLCHQATVDCVEFSARNSPRWALGLPQAYDMRERGLGCADEIAVGMAIVKQTLRDLSARGLSADQVAPSIAWVSGADIDLFEEVAKFRALRRIWARTLQESFGAQDVRSLRLRIACHTSGRALVYNQPLNNLARATIQSLAALLGGVQSLETCTFDEPICIPTEEARELATRTQQILAHEVGAARTADPLGGSYYIESLTNDIERQALARLAEIESIGVIEAVKNGFIERIMDEYNLKVARELADNERIVVGVNKFVRADEPPPRRFSFDRKLTEEHVLRFTTLKQTRDQVLMRQKLQELHTAVQSGRNFHRAMIDALVVDATLGEVWGTVRVAYGYPFDAYRVVECPFDFARGN